MKAGFYEADITPAVGMERPGGYGKSYIGQIHDSLKVRAAVIDDGKDKVALVGIDTCVIQSSSISEIRSEVEKRCGIKKNHILVSASHTHSGGPFFGFLAEDFEDAPVLIKNLALNYSTIADPLYCRLVIKQIVTAICEADRRREAVLLSVSSGYEDKVAFNRRFRMKNGRVFTHPGKGNPDIIGPAGPTDPEVGVLSAWNKGGKFLGCIVNYACHGTTFGGDVSADWIYYLDATIRDAMGKEAVVVFLNGACGDVTQVDNLSLREPEFGERWSRFVGTRVAGEALKVMATAEKGELTPVSATTRVLKIKRRIPDKERLAKSLKVVQQGLKEKNKIATTEWTFAKELVVLDYLVKKEPDVAVEVQAVQVGPAVYLANAAEYFCQFGLDIKKGSPFPFTYVVELANGSIGYIPTPESFLPSGGGYETVLTSYSNLEVTAGEKIKKNSIELAQKLKPGKVPEVPRAKQPYSVWAYGILGPDLG